MADVGDFPAGRSLARYGVEADQEIDGRVELAGDEVDRRVPAPAVPDKSHGMAFGGVDVHDVAHFAAFVVLAEPDVVSGAQIGGIAGADGITVPEDLIEEAADDQNQRPQILRVEGRRFFHEKLFLPPVPDGGQAAQIQKPFGIALKREIHRLFLFY